MYVMQAGHCVIQISLERSKRRSNFPTPLERAKFGAIHEIASNYCSGFVNLPRSIHSRSSSGSCKHSAKGPSWPSCRLHTWLSMLRHMLMMRSPSHWPTAATQYRWLTMGCTHGTILLQSWDLQAALSLALMPEENNVTGIRYPVKLWGKAPHTLTDVPHIKIVLHLGLLLPAVGPYGRVAVCSICKRDERKLTLAAHPTSTTE